jgi:hypothetical protein
VTARCAYCDEPVDPDSPTTYQLAIGWSRAGRGEHRKGGNDIVARRLRPKWACDVCVNRVKRGVSPHQQAML